ncbi:MAG: hypothetical protein WCD35_16660 [Mycobacteriales bacterium]
MSADLLDRLLPVGTLVLGTLLGTVQSGVQGRSQARQAASDLLAEHRRFVYDKESEKCWLELQVYLGRLRGRLRSAGVPLEPIQAFDAGANRLWNAFKDSGDPEIGYYYEPKDAEPLDRALEALRVWLDHPWRPWKRHRRLRGLG